MKFLTELPDEEFLRHCWQIADVAEEVLEKSKIMELRKVLPVLTGEETPEELEQKKKEQAKRTSRLWQKACCSTMPLPPQSCFRCSMSRTWMKTGWLKISARSRRCAR